MPRIVIDAAWKVTIGNNSSLTADISINFYSHSEIQKEREGETGREYQTIDINILRNPVIMPLYTSMSARLSQSHLTLPFKWKR